MKINIRTKLLLGHAGYTLEDTVLMKPEILRSVVGFDKRVMQEIESYRKKEHKKLFTIILSKIHRALDKDDLIAMESWNILWHDLVEKPKEEEEDDV
jgi:hypothetical protein